MVAFYEFKDQFLTSLNPQSLTRVYQYVRLDFTRSDKKKSLVKWVVRLAARIM